MANRRPLAIDDALQATTTALACEQGIRAAVGAIEHVLAEGGGIVVLIAVASEVIGWIMFVGGGAAEKITFVGQLIASRSNSLTLPRASRAVCT